MNISVNGNVDESLLELAKGAEGTEVVLDLRRLTTFLQGL